MSRLSEKIRSYSLWLGVTCLVGVALSAYAVLVELSAELHPGQAAMCDISEHMSCSKVLTSRYGRGFGIVGLILGEDSKFNQPNGFCGIMFYSIISTLGFLESKWSAKLQLGLCALSNLISVYLACVLYFILYDFCIICVSTYLVNLINVVISYKRYKAIIIVETDKKRF